MSRYKDTLIRDACEHKESIDNIESRGLETLDAHSLRTLTVQAGEFYKNLAKLLAIKENEEYPK